MAHPKRAESARALVARAPQGALSVVMDPDPSGAPSALRTALVAWSSIEAAATHHLLVQDDMILSNTFFERARRAIEVMPDAALALFSLWDSRNGAAVRLGALAGARWVPAVNEYTPCAAIILPKNVAAGYVDYARNCHGTWPEDILMHRYLRSAGVRTFIGVPNLAEHQDLSSLAGNAFRGPRLSACFLPADPAAGEDNRLAVLSAVPFFKNGTAQCAVRIPGSRRPRWQHLECEQYLRGWGVPVEDLRSRLPRIAAGLDPAAAWGVWLTSYTLGIVHRVDVHDTAAGMVGPRRPDPDVLGRALASVGPGGLCHTLSAREIAEVRDRLGGLARRGVEAGLEFGAALQSSGRARRPQCPLTSGRVAVVGGNSPLGEYLVRGLSDRGHPVIVVDSAPPDGAHPDVRYVITGRSAAKKVALGLAGVDAVVDLAGLVSAGTRSGEVAPGRDRMDVLTTAAPAHTTPTVVRFCSLEHELADRDAYVLRVGTVYGPGCSPDTVIGRMVVEALLARPITLRSNSTARIYPLHVKDLVEAVSTVLTEGRAGRVRTLTTGTSLAARDVAETVRRVVRPVPIEIRDDPGDEPGGYTFAKAAGGEAVTGTADTREEPGEKQTVRLDYGIRTFAQWLAYETFD